MKEIPKKLPGEVSGGVLFPVDGPCTNPPIVPGKMPIPDDPFPLPMPGPDVPYDGPIF